MWSLILGYLSVFSILAYNGQAVWNAIVAPTLPTVAYIMGSPRIGDVTPTDAFLVTFLKAPALLAVFLASPLLFRFVWKKLEPRIPFAERKWEIPFLVCNTAVFTLAGLGSWAFLFPSYLLNSYWNIGCVLN